MEERDDAAAAGTGRKKGDDDDDNDDNEAGESKPESCAECFFIAWKRECCARLDVLSGDDSASPYSTVTPPHLDFFESILNFLFFDPLERLNFATGGFHMIVGGGSRGNFRRTMQNS